MAQHDTQQHFGKVAVLMGGPSAEREISLKSGAAILAALQESNVCAEAIDVGVDVFEKLQNGKYARALIALHGPLGEDGCIQGGLEVIGMPYSGSGVMASSICMNKLMTKQIWQGCGIPTPKYRVLSDSVDEDELIAELGMPMIFKPISQGSSIGMTKVNSKAEIAPAWVSAHQFEESVIAEQWVEGGEYTVAILDGCALPVIRLETPHTFYDFDAKYQSNDTQYHCPCGLSAALEKQIQALAVHAFDATDASGWGRVDVMLDKNNQPWFLEVNTVPGMTDHSLVPMAAKAKNISFNELVIKILQTSFKEDSEIISKKLTGQISAVCGAT
ncbi:MAG: D-alanine--D-alanine ligase [Gammaproteobacteria bacterium]|nr:MAG: D-alanine--D-alanine ligase [Gammaproteobacteria bacterium]